MSTLTVQRAPRRLTSADVQFPALVRAFLARARRRGALDFRFDFSGLAADAPAWLAQLTERND